MNCSLENSVKVFVKISSVHTWMCIWCTCTSSDVWYGVVFYTCILVLLMFLFSIVVTLCLPMYWFVLLPNQKFQSCFHYTPATKLPGCFIHLSDGELAVLFIRKSYCSYPCPNTFNIQNRKCFNNIVV